MRPIRIRELVTLLHEIASEKSAGLCECFTAFLLLLELADTLVHRFVSLGLGENVFLVDDGLLIDLQRALWSVGAWFAVGLV